MNLNYKLNKLEDIQEDVQDQEGENNDNFCTSFAECLRNSKQSVSVTRFLFNFSKKFQVL